MGATLLWHQHRHNSINNGKNSDVKIRWRQASHSTAFTVAASARYSETQEGNGGTLVFQPLHTSLSLKEGRSLFVSLPLSLVRLTHPLWFTPANWQKENYHFPGAICLAGCEGFHDDTQPKVTVLPLIMSHVTATGFLSVEAKATVCPNPLANASLFSIFYCNSALRCNVAYLLL